MAASRTFDPNEYSIVFAGILIDQGYADGQYIGIVTEGPSFTDKVGVDGEVARSRSADRRATCTISLMQTSPLNDLLSALYNLDREGASGEGVGSFLLKDRQGTTVASASAAWLQNDPDLTLDAEATTRDWELRLADYTVVHGSNN